MNPWCILGVVGGPLAYWGGAQIGAVAFSSDLALIAVGAARAVATPALAALAPGTPEKRPKAIPATGDLAA